MTGSVIGVMSATWVKKRAAQVTAVLYLSISLSAPDGNAALNSSLGHPSGFFFRSCAMEFLPRGRGAAAVRHPCSQSVSARKTNNQRKQNQDQLKHDVLIQRHLSAQVPAEVAARRPKNQALPTLSCAAAILTIIPNCPFLLKRRGIRMNRLGFANKVTDSHQNFA